MTSLGPVVSQCLRQSDVYVGEDEEDEFSLALSQSERPQLISQWIDLSPIKL